MLQDRTNVWLGSAPEFLLSRISRDCDDTINTIPLTPQTKVHTIISAPGHVVVSSLILQ
jgi:hypothetical protein